MDPQKSFAKRILEYITKPFITPDKSIEDDTYHSPNVSLENLPLICKGSCESNHAEKEEYNNLVEQLEAVEKEKMMYKAKEEEYKSLLIDFDSTLSFIMERDCNSKIDEANDKKVDELNAKISTLEKNEKRLQTIICSLRDDLIKMEERVEAYRQIAGEKIDSLVRENERLQVLYEMEKEVVKELRGKNAELDNNVRCVEKMLQNVSLDTNINS